MSFAQHSAIIQVLPTGYGPACAVQVDYNTERTCVQRQHWLCTSAAGGHDSYGERCHHGDHSKIW